MSRCADCGNLCEEIRRLNGTLLYCEECKNYVSPARIACDKFVSTWRTYNEVYNLLNETYYSRFLPNPTKEQKEIPTIIPTIKNEKTFLNFLDRLLKKAGYDENHPRYQDLKDIYNNIIRRFETPDYLEKLDELVDTHIMMEFLVIPNSKEIAKKAVNETLFMRLAYLENDYKKVYKEWLEYLKYLHTLLRMARINNSKLNNYVLKNTK